MPASDAAPAMTDKHGGWRLRVIRLLVALNLGLGAWYLTWRGLYSISPIYPVIGILLFIAEVYSYLDAWLFGLTVWRLRQRTSPPLSGPPETVDVFITCYNEPVELVRQTTRAAIRIRAPHQTFVLDDGD